MSNPFSSDPPPTRFIPWTIMSWASSAGACERHETAQSIIAVTASSIADRISDGETTMTSGRPLAICLPRTSARSSSS